jgi:hypothetical protein
MTTIAGYDRDRLIAALDKLHEEACLAGWPEAEEMAVALGWTDDSEWAEGTWIRSRLHEVLIGARSRPTSPPLWNERV